MLDDLQVFFHFMSTIRIWEPWEHASESYCEASGTGFHQFHCLYDSAFVEFFSNLVKLLCEEQTDYVELGASLTVNDWFCVHWKLSV
jgi:D-hexose-6-phosphate mutarotase